PERRHADAQRVQRLVVERIVIGVPRGRVGDDAVDEPDGLVGDVGGPPLRVHCDLEGQGAVIGGAGRDGRDGGHAGEGGGGGGGGRRAGVGVDYLEGHRVDDHHGRLVRQDDVGPRAVGGHGDAERLAGDGDLGGHGVRRPVDDQDVVLQRQGAED